MNGLGVTLLAVMVPLVFTAPADIGPGGAIVACARYEAERSRDAGSSWAPAALWAAPPSTASAAPPRTPGATDTVWVSVGQSTAQWLAGGEIYRVRGVDAAGNAGGWSNWLVAVAGPDTLWTVESARETAGQRWWVGPVGKFALRYGDAEWARALHQETVQRRHAARIRQLYGYPAPIAGGERWVDVP